MCVFDESATMRLKRCMTQIRIREPKELRRRGAVRMTKAGNDRLRRSGASAETRRRTRLDSHAATVTLRDLDEQARDMLHVSARAWLRDRC